ncbi:MAG: ABC transporter substrate-binding protein [Chloroflexi bacterium]|nr:ABC transporter substrate-binding protein [Chloroflexota bacterium]
MLSEPLDPARIIGAGETIIIRPLYETLVTTDFNWNYAPALATSWVASGEGLTWEFTLRRAVKFHNGYPLSAQDVKFSWERYLDPATNTAGGAALRGIVDSVDANDDYRVTFRTKAPDPTFLDRLQSVISKKYLGEVGEQRFDKAPVGTGPFKYAKHSRGEFYEFEAFEDHYAIVPSIRTLNVRIVPEPSTRIAMLKTGEADFIDGVVGPMIEQVRTTPGARLIRVPMTSAADLVVMELYTEEPSPFKDLRVRRALAHAIDRKAIAERLYFSEASPQITPSFFPNTFGFDASVKEYAYDPDLAKRLLAEAGYPNGFNTEITGYASSLMSGIPELLEAVGSYYDKIGVKTKITRLDAGTYLARLREKKLAGLAVHLGLVNRDGGWTAEQYYGEGRPYSSSKDPAMWELIRRQAREIDVRKREETLKEIVRRGHNTLERIPTVYSNTVFGAGPRVKDWKPFPGNPYAYGFEYLALKD